MAASVLLIDDDPSTAPALESVLLHEGYEVERARLDQTVLGRVRRDPPALVILSIDKSAGEWAFCRQLLGCFAGRLFLLLSSNSEALRAKGLSMGAIDCLSKPFPIVEFTARVRAVLRRDMTLAARVEREYFVDGHLAVDLARREVRRNGRRVRLTPTEFRLLTCLVQHADQLLPSAQLMEEVWGPGHDRKPETLWTHIRNLRQKLEPDPEQPQRIVYFPRKGYVFQVLGTGD